MAMPQPSDAHGYEMPQQTPSAAPPPVAAARRPSEQQQPPSGTRARGPAAKRLTPDEEAMLLMMKVVDRVEVAKSFAKIAAGLLTVTAARASEQLRAVADAKVAETVEREGGLKARFEHVRKIARAAKDAAIHVATHRPTRERDEEESEPIPSTQDAPVTQDAPNTQDAPTQAAPLTSPPTPTDNAAE
jgi:hypothetical protein